MDIFNLEVSEPVDYIEQWNICNMHFVFDDESKLGMYGVDMGSCGMVLEVTNVAKL
jgi:hypothetical protein